MHEILTVLNHPNRNIPTLRDDDCLQGHHLTLHQPRVCTKLRSNTFSAHVPFTWNQLPPDLVEVASTDACERKFNAHAHSEGVLVTKALFPDGKSIGSDPWASD